jgi:RimJ/RimL family protein N-acetyltransferase
VASICLGASDPHRLAARVATIAANALPEWRIEAIVPNDQWPLLPKALEQRNPRFIASSHRQDMPTMLAASHLAIGAGGVGTWERCVLGVPSAVIVTAENQLNNVRGASISGACISLGDWRTIDEVRWGTVIAAIARDRDALIRMSSAAAGLCDGLGVERIVALLGNRDSERSEADRTPRATARQAEGNSEGLWIRSATTTDCRAMFDFQCEPGARAHFRNPEPPTWEEHARWYAKMMGSEDRWIGVVCVDSTPAGMIRLDWREEDCWFEVSILISGASRGRGVGRAVLRSVRERLTKSTLLAEVSEANAPSQRAFAAAGFARIAPDIFIARAPR